VVVLVRKGSYTTLKLVKDTENLAVKMDFFPKKPHSEILVREKVFRPPKLGARSPPLLLRTNTVAEWQTKEDAYCCTYAVSWQSYKLSSTTSHKTSHLQWTHETFREDYWQKDDGFQK